MLEMISLDADNVVGFRVEGKLSDREFEEVVSAIEDKLSRHERLRIYAEVTSFGGMPMQSLVKDARFGLRNWRRFEKEAIVTDKAWLRKLGQASDKVLPGMEVRAFATSEQAAARDWVQR